MGTDQNQNNDLDMNNPWDRDEYSSQQANKALKEVLGEGKPNFENLPRYFDVDDTPVLITRLKDDDVIGLTWSGHPYPPLKAIAEGREININQYVELMNQKIK
jgi:hypothetical protein